MNLEKFARSQPFEEIERSNLFMATVDGSKVFYAIKAFEVRDDGSDDDLIVCLGPPVISPKEGIRALHIQRFCPGRPSRS